MSSLRSKTFTPPNTPGGIPANPCPLAVTVGTVLSTNYSPNHAPNRRGVSLSGGALERKGLYLKGAGKANGGDAPPND